MLFGIQAFHPASSAPLHLVIFPEDLDRLSSCFAGQSKTVDLPVQPTAHRQEERACSCLPTEALLNRSSRRIVQPRKKEVS